MIQRINKIKYQIDFLSPIYVVDAEISLNNNKNKQQQCTLKSPMYSSLTNLYGMLPYHHVVSESIAL